MKKELSPQFNYKLLDGYKRVCVACSGGIDSIALLHVLSEYRQKHKFELYAVNIDHDLRETSKRDSLFVKQICKSLKVTLFSKKVKVKAIAKRKKLGIEECAREERYKFFDQLINDNMVDVIALAHHNQDDIETMLMNLSRGCFLNGLYGIKEQRDHFIRPMLMVKKGEIKEFAQDRNLEYMHDETNDDIAYSRNYVRREILPKIIEKFPNFENSFMSMKNSIKTDEEHFDKYVSQALIFEEDCVKVKIYKIFDDQAVAFRAYLKALAHLGITKNVYKANLEEIHSLLEKENGKYVCVKDGICCFKDYGQLTFERNKSYFNQTFEIQVGEYIVGDKLLKIQPSERYESEFMATYIDGDKLPEDAILRRREQGDMFARKAGTKKLKSFLIDVKIPQRERDDLFVIASGKTVLAVCGVECGRDLLITEQTTNILKITYKKFKIYTEDKNV
ncbi:MAG: tRNA lysidine(34) synthetase TilS [Bacillota bacterium]